MNKIIETIALIFVFTVVAACQPGIAKKVIDEPDDEFTYSCEKWKPETPHPDDSKEELYRKLSENTAMQRLCDGSDE